MIIIKNNVRTRLIDDCLNSAKISGFRRSTKIESDRKIMLDCLLD